MTRTFRCPECGELNPLAEDRAGRVTSCEHCGSDILVPASEWADQAEGAEKVSQDVETSAVSLLSPAGALLICAVPVLGFVLAQAFC